MCVCITAGNVLIFCALFKENLALMTFRLVLFCSASNYLTHFPPLSVTCSVAPDRHVQLLLLPCFVHSSSMSFSFLLPHGTASVWECCSVLLKQIQINHAMRRLEAVSPLYVWCQYMPTHEHRASGVFLWTGPAKC